MNHTFVVYVDNKPGVLNRVASLFRRRAFNIESLTVGPTYRPEISRMTIVMDCPDETVARRVEANLYKLVNVIKVDDITEMSIVARDLLLIKVESDEETRPQILQIVEAYHCRVVDMTIETIMLECTGPEDKITNLIEILEPFGIVEMARTGLVAMTRGKEAIAAVPEFIHAVAPVAVEEMNT